MELITDLWTSFRSLPVWVQVWVAIVLVPVNSASLLFLGEPSGGWIALLAVVAMLCNVPIMIAERGFSKLMAFPHLPLWTPLVLWLILDRPAGSEAFGVYLSILLVVDTVSLAFDYPDAWRWLKGDREIARYGKPL